MARKKQKLGPRRKRMTRHSRLGSAKATAWVTRYCGENIVKGYAKWIAVDLLCAVLELRMLGVAIAPEQEAQIKASIEAGVAAKKRKEKAAMDAKSEEFYADSDGIFAHIAGYTPGGAAYGVRWEELGEEPP